MKKVCCLILFLLYFLVGCSSIIDEYIFLKAKDREVINKQAYENNDILLPETLWQKPDYVDLADNQRFIDEGIMTNPADNQIKSILVDGQTYNGKKTKFYAFLGIPSTASTQNKVPAIVLVHGGLGTAYLDWVELWVKRGYVAIAMDTEGQAPSVGSLMTNNFITKLPEEIRGPKNSGWYEDQSKDVKEQWIYHALCTVISSNSIVRSLDVVDLDKVGITGISWGGLVTTLATIYDNRFAFSIPVYGTVNMTGTDANFGIIYKSMTRASKLWDDGSGIISVKTPMMFINGDTDYHFSTLGTTKSYQATKYSKMLIIPSLQHDQYSGAIIKEVETFASMVCQQQNKFIEIKKMPEKGSPEMEFSDKEVNKIEKLELFETESQSLTGGTVWKKTLLSVKQTVKYKLSSNTKHYYILVTSNTKNRVSTGIISL